MPLVDPRDEIIAELRALIVEQRAQIEKLTARVGELEAQLGQSSRNSSKPPSSDGPAKVPRTQAPTGRKPGGQPGHKGHSRELVPPEAVDERKLLVPQECGDCHGPVEAKEDAPLKLREQQVDIPVIKPHVVEFIVESRWCPRCGMETIFGKRGIRIAGGAGKRGVGLAAW